MRYTLPFSFSFLRHVDSSPSWFLSSLLQPHLYSLHLNLCWLWTLAHKDTGSACVDASTISAHNCFLHFFSQNQKRFHCNQNWKLADISKIVGNLTSPTSGQKSLWCPQKTAVIHVGACVGMGYVASFGARHPVLLSSAGKSWCAWRCLQLVAFWYTIRTVGWEDLSRFRFLRPKFDLVQRDILHSRVVWVVSDGRFMVVFCKTRVWVSGIVGKW